MINRIIDISESGYFLRIHNKLLEIQQHGQVKITIMPEDIACLILSNAQLTITQSVLAALSNAGTLIIACDDKHIPCGIMMPISNNQLHTERLAAQCQASVPLKKQLWKQVIALKIKNQGLVLQKIKNDDFGLLSLSKEVKTGDNENVEGRAAARYFKYLFIEPFLREREANNANCALNYGYMVLRAIVARALCSTGLHPAIGINHHNRYNPFCLADDLIEPYRPIVDYIIATHEELHSCNELNSNLKSMIIKPIIAHIVAFHDTKHDIFHAVARTASSLVTCYIEKKPDLLLPIDFFPR